MTPIHLESTLIYGATSYTYAAEERAQKQESHTFAPREKAATA